MDNLLLRCTTNVVRETGGFIIVQPYQCHMW